MFHLLYAFTFIILVTPFFFYNHFPWLTWKSNSSNHHSWTFTFNITTIIDISLFLNFSFISPRSEIPGISFSLGKPKSLALQLPAKGHRKGLCVSFNLLVGFLPNRVWMLKSSICSLWCIYRHLKMNVLNLCMLGVCVWIQNIMNSFIDI